MLQKLASLFSRTPKPILAPIHDGNVIVITANVRHGTVTVSHKGKVKIAKFSDATLRQMVKGKRFRKNAEMFVGCIAHLLEQLIPQDHAD